MKTVNDEKGIYVTFVAIILVAMLYFIGLAIDGGVMEFRRMHLQRATDAAAVVGGSRIGDISKSDVEKLALLVAQDNMQANGLTFDAKNINTKMVTNTNLEVSTLTPSNTFIIGHWVNGTSVVDLSAVAASQKRPVAVTLVVDTSGSMNDSIGKGRTKLDALKSAAKTFVNSFDETKDALSLVTFNESATASYPLAKPFSKADLSKVIDGLNANGKTNTDSGMTLANAELNKVASVIGAGYDAYLKVIVLITDGAPNLNAGGKYPAGCPSDQNKKDIVFPILQADYARANGTVVFTIGIGSQDSNVKDAFQTQPTSSGVGSSLIKRVMLHRLANDITSASADPVFPTSCFANFDASKPTGRYLESTDPNDISYMLNQVSLAIKMRLTK